MNYTYTTVFIVTVYHIGEGGYVELLIHIVAKNTSQQTESTQNVSLKQKTSRHSLVAEIHYILVVFVVAFVETTDKQIGGRIAKRKSRRFFKLFPGTLNQEP